MKDAPTPNEPTRKDVQQVIEGSFSPDHLGPDRFEKVRQDVLSNAAGYLDVLDTMVGSAPTELLALWWPSTLLEITHARAPDRTLASARLARGAYDRALQSLAGTAPRGDPSRAARIAERRDLLDGLVRRWDAKP